jgi:protein gp37
MAKRLKAMGNRSYRNGFDLTPQPHMLDLPVEYIQRVFDVMRDANWRQFQVPTKRSDRLMDPDTRGDLLWAPQIWMGVSVENADYVERIDHLRKTDAHVKFLSLEPLLD